MKQSGSLGYAGNSRRIFSQSPDGLLLSGGQDVQRHRHSGGWGTACLSLLLGSLTLGAGCTMCPSPFDYSGTVPGAADQNDFRVRNNGILPIWQRPRPWPPVVSADPVEDRPIAPPPATRRIAVSDIATADEPENISVLLTAVEEQDATDEVITASGE